jgi:hypothetical protein
MDRKLEAKEAVEVKTLAVGEEAMEVVPEWQIVEYMMVDKLAVQKYFRICQWK